MTEIDRKAIAAGAFPDCDCDDCLVIYEHTERRVRLHLPEPNATHDCQADDGEYACYGGQWTVHGPHDYPARRANWRGGGDVKVHCPGKTPETILGASAGGR